MTAAERQPRHFVNSLAKGFEILEAFTPKRTHLTLGQLAEQTGYNKTTVQRLTDTLMRLGYLGRDGRKAFFLSPKVFSLGCTYLNGLELRRLAETHLRDFAVAVDRTVNMAVLDGGEVVFVYRYEVERFFEFGIREGVRLPAHCTASGKILLAGLPPGRRNAHLSEIDFQALTPRTVTGIDQLSREIEKARRRGYGVCDREASPVLYAVAAPVVNHEGESVAAINVSLTASGLEDEAAAEVTRGVVERGRRISRAYGYEGPYPWPDAEAASVF